MNAAACSLPVSSSQPDNSRFQSAMFQFPGRPLPLARRLAVYNRVKRILREFMEDQRFNEVPAPATGTQPFMDGMLDRGFPAVWSECRSDSESNSGGELIRAMGAELDQDALLLLQRILLRTVVGKLSADLLGGRQITRLDRVLTCEHPQMSYDEARQILADHGRPVAPDQGLDANAKAALSRFCNNQPVLVTGIPASMAAPALGDMVENAQDAEYQGFLLPYSGLTMVGVVYPGQKFRAGFTLDLSRLLQFLMGLEKIEDTVINPKQGMATA